jgi:hypothetical protein
MRHVRNVVAAFAASFDAAVLSGADAAAVRADAAAAQHMLGTVVALAAKREADAGRWAEAGAKSPAHHLARTTGTSVGAARGALGAAEQMASLPELEAAARRGELSPAQVAPIAEAAGAEPGAAGRLIDLAARASLGELIDECARTKANAEPDPEARHRAVHASRHVRTRRTADGAAELRYRSTPEEVAEVFSVVQGYADVAFDAARRAGRPEPEEAYLADGLLAAVRAARDGADAGGSDGAEPNGVDASGRRRRRRRPTPAKVIVRIDWDALVRGYPIEGELCEIAGFGPVPVSVVRAIIDSGDGFLAALLTRGTDVASVVHLGRRPTALQATALQWLSPTCIAQGCNNSRRIQTDHREDWARTKVTLLDWLDPLCQRCHDLKTLRGWGLVAGKGKRAMVPPDDPRHPRHAKSPPPPRRRE